MAYIALDVFFVRLLNPNDDDKRPQMRISKEPIAVSSVSSDVSVTLENVYLVLCAAASVFFCYGSLILEYKGFWGNTFVAANIQGTLGILENESSAFNILRHHFLDRLEKVAKISHTHAHPHNLISIKFYKIHEK